MDVICLLSNCYSELWLCLWTFIKLPEKQNFSVSCNLLTCNNLYVKYYYYTLMKLGLNLLHVN